MLFGSGIEWREADWELPEQKEGKVEFLKMQRDMYVDPREVQNEPFLSENNVQRYMHEDLNKLKSLQEEKSRNYFTSRPDPIVRWIQKKLINWKNFLYNNSFN